MTAKEYAKKYERVGDPNCPMDERGVLLAKLFMDFLNEMKALAEKRRIGSDAALNALKKEFNIKGNRVSVLLNGVLAKNWFNDLWNKLDEEERRKCNEDNTGNN